MALAADRLARPDPSVRWAGLAGLALGLALAWPLETLEAMLLPGGLAALGAGAAGLLAGRGRRLGAWRLLRLLGEGATAEVWLARRPGSVEPVALKILHAHLRRDESQVRRFRLEGRLLARVRSPHVIRVLAQGEQDGRPYVVLEHVPGQPLSREPPRDATQAMDVAVALLRALGALHRVGILHRDLTPDNVLLRPGRTLRWRPVLSDLGSGRDLRGRATTGLLSGTPATMSPERLAGAAATSGDDLYAWATVVSGWGVPLPQALSAAVADCLGPSEGRPNAVDGVLDALLAAAPDPGDPVARAQALARAGHHRDAGEAWGAVAPGHPGRQLGLLRARLRAGPLDDLEAREVPEALGPLVARRVGVGPGGLPWRWSEATPDQLETALEPDGLPLLRDLLVARAAGEPASLLAAAVALRGQAVDRGDLYLEAVALLGEAWACQSAASPAAAAASAHEALQLAEDLGARGLAIEAGGLAARSWFAAGRRAQATGCGGRALASVRHVHEHLADADQAAWLEAHQSLLAFTRNLAQGTSLH